MEKLEGPKANEEPKDGNNTEGPPKKKGKKPEVYG